MNLLQRIQAETPIWFKRIISIGLILSAVGGAILGASEVIDGFVLTHGLKMICQYFVLTGLVAAAISKTSVTKDVGTLGIVLFMLFISITSCTRKMYVQPKLVIKDSVHDSIIYVPKQTTITIAGDSVTIHDTLNCPDAVYHKELKSATGKTTATVRLFKGNLIVDCKADSMQKVIDWLQKELLRTYTHTETETVIQEVKVDVYRVPKWCWWLLGINILYIGSRILIWRFKVPIKL